MTKSRTKRAADPAAAPLSREQLNEYAAQSLAIESVPVPQWGGVVLIRKLSAADQMCVEPLFVQIQMGDAEALAKFSFELVARSICDAAGQRLYSDSPEDREALGALDPDGFVVVLNAVKAKRARHAKQAKN